MGVSYSSAEMQSVYSTAPVDWIGDPIRYKHWIRVCLRTIAVKGYSVFPKVPALLEPHHQRVSCYIQDIRWWRCLTLLHWSNRYILLPQSTELQKAKLKKQKAKNKKNPGEQQNNKYKIVHATKNNKMENKFRLDKDIFQEPDILISSSSSSCHAGSTDIPDPLSPLLPIVHRPRQVFRTTSRILT